MKAVLCPVCNGRGTIHMEGFYSTCLERTCHGCNGQGWVVVPECPGDIPFTPYKEPNTTAGD